MSTIKSRNFIRVLFLLTLLSPPFSFAAGNMGFEGLDALIQGFAKGVVTSTGYLMFTLAVIAFFFGIVQFIWSARQGAEGKGIQRGTQFIKWGLIAIFVMFSVWGIIKFAQGVFGIQGDNTIIVPSLSFQQSGENGVRPTVGALGGLGANGSTCKKDDDCRDNQRCLSNLCVNPASDASGSGNQQNGGTQNGNGAGNVNGGGGIVSKKGLGSNCTESPECTSNYCDVNNECSIAIKGTKGFGYSCVDTTECKSGLYCGADYLCTTTEVIDKKSWGYSCDVHTECETGFCDPSTKMCDTKTVGGTRSIGGGGLTSGSCQAAFTGCTTSSGQTGQCDEQLNCNFKDMNTYGCRDKTASNWDPYANTDNGTCITGNNVGSDTLGGGGIYVTPGSDGTQLECDPTVCI